MRRLGVWMLAERQLGNRINEQFHYNLLLLQGVIMLIRFGSLCLLIVTVVVVSGCTSQNYPPPLVAKVTGKVNLDGKAMSEGEVRFMVSGQPPRAMPIKNGEFAGEAFVGRNRVDIILEKDGPPSTTDKKEPIKINTVQHKNIEVEVSKSGANTFTLDAQTSK